MMFHPAFKRFGMNKSTKEPKYERLPKFKELEPREK